MNKLIKQLIDAIADSDIDFLRKNRNRYYIDERLEDQDNDTLLLYAINYADSEACYYLLDNGADYHLVNDEDENIVHAIVYSGCLDRLVYFVNNYEIDINKQSIDGTTPLLQSISLEFFDIAKYLISKGADVNIPDEDGISPVGLAVQLNELELVKDLINSGVILNTVDNKGRSPLRIAAEWGHWDLVQAIINSGADIATTLNDCLLHAILDNKIDFLSKNKDRYNINYRLDNSKKETLLCYAMSLDDSDVCCDFLLDNGADCTLLNEEEENIIHAIVYSRNLERLVHFLNNYEIDINKQSADGTTPLLLSISLEFFDIAKYLISKGADVNINDGKDFSPLEMAVMYNDLQLVQILVDSGANIRYSTSNSISTLALAANNTKNDEIVKFLFNRIYGD